MHADYYNAGEWSLGKRLMLSTYIHNSHLGDLHKLVVLAEREGQDGVAVVVVVHDQLASPQQAGDHRH